jgi:hypothetical protein
VPLPTEVVAVTSADPAHPPLAAGDCAAQFDSLFVTLAAAGLCTDRRENRCGSGVFDTLLPGR